MSIRPLVLEDFNARVIDAPREVHDGERFEAERLEAFDKGYAAGWDDATDAAEREAAAKSQAMEARLEELSFTFHEARAHVMRGLAPLFEAIIQTALPRILHDTLGARLEQALSDMAEAHSNPEVRILTAIGEADEVEAALGNRQRFPVSFEEDDGIAPGVVQLRMGQRGHEIDLNALGQVLNDALSALDNDTQKAMSNV